MRQKEHGVWILSLAGSLSLLFKYKFSYTLGKTRPGDLYKHRTLHVAWPPNSSRGIGFSITSSAIDVGSLLSQICLYWTRATGDFLDTTNRYELRRVTEFNGTWYSENSVSIETEIWHVFVARLIYLKCHTISPPMLAPPHQDRTKIKLPPPLQSFQKRVS